MNYVVLPDNTVRKLSFYLAMEEYIARYKSDEDHFFMWQVNPTVIFGRNQLMENEINFDYIKSRHIEYYRRKSGGGCVFADFSNIMFSYITKDFNVGFTFDRYLRLVAHTLNKLGVKAQVSGRNDIEVDGRKVSGNAFYRIAGKSIVHGTMLFDTDLGDLVRSITPCNEKLVSKGVESVRKRVANLKEFLDIDIEEFKTFMRSQLCDKEIILDDGDVDRIKEIEKEYLNDEWILGNNPRYTLVKKGYGEAGEVEIRLEIKKKEIKGIDLKGDYFLIGEMGELLNSFVGIPFRREEVEKVLDKINLHDYILNLSREKFLAIIFDN
ncbi:lipoate--protein ligase [Coprobacter tertius]|uniref:lipoate--protein ligase n=1 Tax=Coprobacter tertius TaxID=2944915 RepID=A0ABT1MI48_9BACT|nr:lipoate--protein ligase [Coprobacter tertius]MCP9612302.1 lipoate--protein ligase [Coprobacter tertius]